MGAISRKGGSDRPGDYRWCAVDTVPAGWLACFGAAISRAAYPALFSAIGTTYGAGDGVTTFNVPDMRSEFPRGADAGRGVDSGRVFGSAQSDAYQGHAHQVEHSGGAGAVQGYSQTPSQGWAEGNPAGVMHYAKTPAADGVNGTPRTAAETRPRNVAGLFIIKY